MAEMQLEQFVTETLSQIVRGVKASMAVVQEHGGKVNPPLTYRGDDKQALVGGKVSPVPLASVQFDVALTVSGGTESKAGIAVVAGVFGAGARGTSSAETSQVSRVKFSVPVMWPRPE